MHFQYADVLRHTRFRYAPRYVESLFHVKQHLNSHPLPRHFGARIPAFTAQNTKSTRSSSMRLIKRCTASHSLSRNLFRTDDAITPAVTNPTNEIKLSSSLKRFLPCLLHSRKNEPTRSDTFRRKTKRESFSLFCIAAHRVEMIFHLAPSSSRTRFRPRTVYPIWRLISLTCLYLYRRRRRRCRT